MSTKTNLIKTVLMLLSFTTIIMIQGCGEDKKTETKYTVSGTMSGLSGTLVLQNNGGDDLTVAANGAFTVLTALTNGSGYSVTVKTQPTGQTCTVTNGSGTISSGNVINVAVACAGSATAIYFNGLTPGSNSIYMDKNSSLSSGSVLAIDIKVDSVSNVFGAAFDIDFDSTKMIYSGYSAGSFLEGSGNSVTYIASQAVNKLIVGVSRQAPSGGQSGSGTLVTLKFNVTGGTSASFSNNSLKDSSGNTISATWSSGGTVTVP